MNSDQVPDATLSQVLCSSVRIDNCRALADRYRDLTGMTTWVVWNTEEYGGDRLCLLDQGQLNSLRLDTSGKYRLIYCSDRESWIITPEQIDPPLAYGHVRDLKSWTPPSQP
jgi:hypothetical protein